MNRSHNHQEKEDSDRELPTTTTLVRASVEPSPAIGTAVETNIEVDGTIARHRFKENNVSSPKCKTLTKKHDLYAVEYDQVCNLFLAYITLPRTDNRQAGIKYSLGMTEFLFPLHQLILFVPFTSFVLIASTWPFLILFKAHTNLKPKPFMPATKRQYCSGQKQLLIFRPGKNTLRQPRMNRKQHPAELRSPQPPCK